jgi:transcriptional regulator with XRE-family HTH domain
MNIMNKRIKDIRLALDMTQIQFSDRIGIKQSSLSAIENGVTETIDERNIRIICKEFNISEDWLRYGTGDMFRTEEGLLELIAVKLDDLDDLDRKIISEYLKLSPKHKKIMKDFIKKLF